MPGSTPHHRAGAGTPLVLLHGLSGTWRIWEPVLPALGEVHDVYAPTLPGHRGGPPTRSGETISIATLADGVERSLTRAGIERAHLVGNSLGGWLALELARRGRALSVVGLSPAGAWATERDLARVVRLIRAGTRAGIAMGPYIRWALRSPGMRKAFVRQTMERGDLVSAVALGQMLSDLRGCAALAHILEAIPRDGGFAPLAGPLDCPVRIAWGTQDRTIPFERYGAPYMERVPGAELVHLQGVGHVPMYDDPELVVRTILEVTGAVPATSSTGDAERVA